MEIDKSLFYPLTPFHLICSTILRNKLNYKFNVLILDSNLFDDILINQIKKTNKWNKIFILTKSSNHFTILHSTKYLNKILPFFDNDIYNIYFFSPGINKCNLIINKLSHNNKLFLCDDGIAPYYFNSSILKFWQELTKKNKLKLYFLKFINFFTNIDYQFNLNEEIKLILMNKDLSSLIIEKHLKINIENVDKHLALNELANYYSYLIPEITINYKIVFFHSEKFDFDKFVYSSLLKKYSDQEIFHCFRQRTNNKYISLYQSHNNNVPWEILHYLFLNNFKESILISSSFTTAFINTINPYIGNNKRIIINEDYIYKPALFDKIINLLNKNSKKPICILKNINEL